MKRRVSSSLVAATIAVLLALPAQANIVDFTGSTGGGPTYNRLLEDLSGLSAVGTNVAYRNDMPRASSVSSSGLRRSTRNVVPPRLARVIVTST